MNAAEPGPGCPTNLADCPFAIEHDNVATVAAKHGIELRGDDGQPYHHGQRMTVRSLLGAADYARCEVCELTIGDLLSPAVNGGYVFDDPIFDGHENLVGHATWALLTPATDRAEVSR